MGVSKVIYGLIGFQTVLVLGLMFQSFSLQNQVSDLSKQVIPASLKTLSTSTNSDSKSGSEMADFDSQYLPTHSDIRDIVSEEISKYADQYSFQIGEVANQAKAKEAPQDQFVTQQINADVMGQINALSTQSEISAGDMARLENNIAKLPARQRIEALKELNRAMNKGNIQARF